MKRLIIIIAIISTNYNALATITNQVMPVSYFVDHVIQLKKIEINLNKYNKTTVIGTSGIGKTQLIRMYAHENKSKYEIIWFFDSKLNIDAEFSRLANAINLKASAEVVSTNVSRSREQVMNYLSYKNNWLLIFDNNITKQNHKILDFVNWDNNGHVIFASQDRELLPHVINVDTFNKQDSIILANNIIEEQNSDLIAFITNEFKGYPVLIVQAAQLLNNIPGLDKDVYKQKIINNSDKIKLNIELAINALTDSAKELLHKIALINNQRFSKRLLSIISNNPSSLDMDLYELSKFALISNIETSLDNQIFEMHDIIAINILQLNSPIDRKTTLESIIISLTRAMPEGVHKGHIFRTSKTMHENLEVIFTNISKYKPDILKLMEFNLILVSDYINTMNSEKAKILVDWFEEHNANNQFKLDLMSEYERYIYARYLGAVGGYHRLTLHDQTTAINYFQTAKQILYKIDNYYDIRSNTIYQLALSQIGIGLLDEASKNIQIISQMTLNKLISESESGLIHLATAKLLCAQGDFNTALQEVNKDISESIKFGLDKNDILFSSTYILKTGILNHLDRYKESLIQAQALYNIYKAHKNDDHECFGYLYAQMAKSYLGLGNITESKVYLVKALKILAEQGYQSTKQARRLATDIELAKVHLIHAEILLADKQFKEAIVNYEIAEGIYRNAYKNNANKMHDIIYVVYRGAVASSKIKDNFWYNHFYNSLQQLLGDPRHKMLLNLDQMQEGLL